MRLGVTATSEHLDPAVRLQLGYYVFVELAEVLPRFRVLVFKSHVCIVLCQVLLEGEVRIESGDQDYLAQKDRTMILRTFVSEPEKERKKKKIIQKL